MGIFKLLGVLLLSATLVILFMDEVGDQASDEACEIIWTSIDVNRSSQGDAHLITVSDESMLIDAGTAGAGAYMVTPFLQKSAITSIDVAVSSHAHKDHYGGLEHVSNSVAVDGLIAHSPTENSCATESPSWGCNFDHYYPSISNIKRKRDIVPAVSTIIGTPSCGVDLIYHYDGENGDIGITDVNNATGIYRINANGNTALLTGDIGKVTGDYLAMNMPDLVDVDVYKYPHHGATHHAGEVLLKAASPLSIVVPAPTWLITHERGIEAFNQSIATPAKSFWNGRDGNVTYTFTDDEIYACEGTLRHEMCKSIKIK